MRWEELFEDLDGQADAWERAERDAEVADRFRAEVAQLQLINRLRACEGSPLVVRLLGGRQVKGMVARLGADWLLLDAPQEVVIPVWAIATVSDLPLASVGAGVVSPVASRLTLRSVLRRLAQDRARITVLLRDESSVVGTPDRTGQDFLDLAVHDRDEAPRRSTVTARVTIRIEAIVAVVRESGLWS